MRVMSNRAKRWALTIFDIDNGREVIESASIGRYIYQEEKCPTTGRHHLQAFVEFKQRVSFTHVRGLFTSSRVKQAEGTPWQNYVYCTKDETRVHGGFRGQRGEFVEPRSARRSREGNSLDPMIDDIKLGMGEREIARKYPKQFLLHSRGVPTLIQHFKPEAKSRPLCVIVLFGSTGTGKSHWARQYAVYNGLKFFNKPSGQWWGGYDGQEVIIFDDFGPDQIPYRDMLRYLDNYVCTLDVKSLAGGKPSTYSQVVITTNLSISEWYPLEDRAPLQRRINHTFMCDWPNGYATDNLEFRQTLLGLSPR